jgi:Lamin Tail Domain/CHU_C Type IX secretion signal domain/Bacterial Ig-like domain
MRLKIKHTTTLMLCFLLALSCIAQINENFTDGDFTNNPTWNGNTTSFTIDNGRLRSDDLVVGSKFYLTTSNTIATNCQWEFNINLQLNTSSLNFTDIYLVSNNNNVLLNSNVNGYFLRFGGTKDEINFYKRNNTTETLLIDGRDGELNKSNNVYKVKVIRNAANQFKLYTDSTGTGNVYVLRDSVLDNSYLTTNYFGFFIAQSTSTFFQKHFFDNIYVGPIIVDLTPPQLLSVQLVNNNQVKLTFNEVIDTTYAKNLLLYNINNANNQSATVVNQIVPNKNNLSEIDLFFNPAITNRGTYTCFVVIAKDIAGNTGINLSKNFTVSNIEKFDLVINELMVDPTPVVGLPDVEYIELYNRSGLDLNLKNTKVSVTSTSANIKTISTSDYILKADSFVVLCDASDTSQLKTIVPSYVKIIGIISFPALTNEKALVQILDANTTIISFINYSDTWYQAGFKKDGGWSLEQIDANNPCGEINNWKASVNALGGTPGRKNSIQTNNTDNEGPKAIQAIAISADTLLITFNEKLNPKVIDTNLYRINQGIGKPKGVFGYSLTTKSIKLKINGAFQTNILYTLSINDSIADCAGNKRNQTQTINFALPLMAKANELQINEILFNPKTGGEEYIELYNNSGNYFDLSQYAFANYDTINKTFKDIKKISNDRRLILPYEYLLISPKSSIVGQQFPKGKTNQFIDMSGFASLDDKSEVIYILDNLNTPIDYVQYNESWHYALLNSKDGVALERLSNQLPSNDRNNWASAASTEDYGTPGYKNSQTAELNYNNEISFNSNSFSPDNDGYNDLLIINYNFENGAQSATVNVYNDAGIKVKSLANNSYISQQGTFTWDGIKDNNEKANIGNYMLVFELNNDKGKAKIIKKLFAVATKTN